MNYRLVEHAQNSYIETQAGDGRIEKESDALDLIGGLAEYQIHRIMLHDADLSEDFYNLRTGLAGAVLQKFAQYSVKVAAVLPREKAEEGRFGEMVLEANRRNRLFHVFEERDQAEAWLVGD